MFIVKYYLAGATLALIVAMAATHWLISLVMIWISLSLAAVSIAYIFDIPTIFRKREDGKIARWIKWLFIPFLIGAKAYNAYSRKNDTVPPIQQVEPNLYVCARLLPKDIDELKAKNISCIVDVTAEFAGLESAVSEKSFQYLTIPTLDHRVPSIKKLIHALHWIDTQINDSKSVAVHCALGRGRSVFVVAAYLLIRNPKLTVEQALQKVNQIRHTAQLNSSQTKILHTIYRNKQLRLSSPVWLVVNPVSGGGKWKEYHHQIIKQLTQKYRLIIKRTTPETSAETIARDAVKAGAKKVIAGGGDGTIAEVAKVLMNTDITLGILPLGTANALSHVLYGISVKVSPVSTVCNALLSDTTQKIDTAICNDHLMLLVLGIGFEHKMIEFAHREQKDKLGQLAYLTGFFDAVIAGETQKLSLKIDDADFESIDIQSLVVSNIAPFSTILAHSGKSPEIDDGQLQIGIMKKQPNLVNRVISISDLTLSSLGIKENAEYFENSSAQHITITGDKPIQYSIDGELYSDDKLDITIKPQSLKICM